MSAIDKNITTGLTVFGIIASVGVGLHDTRVLYLIPSLAFMFLMIIMTKSVTVGILATYCFTIETKLRNRFQPGEIGMEWEGDALGFKSRDPLSLLGFGVFLAFLPVAGGFVVLSIMCYHFWKPSAAIHIGEALLLTAYACGCLRWNRIAYRKRVTTIRRESAEQATEGDGTKRAAP
jgi:hypothetical protein